MIFCLTRWKIIVACLFIIPCSVYANFLKNTNNPISIEADQFSYLNESNENKIIAKGKAEITQDSKKITANIIEYNIKKDQLIAEDKVKLFESEGYIIDADKILLHDKLKYGTVNNFKVSFPDQSILTGDSAEKENESLSKIKNGYYTACKLCSGKHPIWDISAKSVNFDQENNRFIYHNALIRYYGLPIFYTPYFSHYSKKAERKSGFLNPSYGNNTYLGKFIKVPYYFNLAPNYDLVVRPVFTTERKQFLEGEYRHLLSNGGYKVFASFAPTKFNAQDPAQSKSSLSYRYTVDSKGDFDLSRNISAGWSTKITSDKTFRRNYKYGEEDFLTTKLYLDSFQNKNFYQIESLAFQDLRPDTPMYQSPIILPIFNSDHQIHQFSDNSTINLETNLLKVYRYVGAETNRVSAKAIWQKPLLLDNGHNFILFTSLRNDIYYYRNASINSQNYTGFVTRAIPEVGVHWSYPLGRSFNNTNVIITPLASFIYTPMSNYNNEIYSEDSQTSELSDSNLFTSSQFTGLDLVETTPRISYGIDAMAYFQNNFNFNALLGQIYRQSPQNYLTGQKGGSRLSDYVGRLKFDFANKVILSYHFKLDQKTKLNKANELTLLLKQNKIYLLTDLLYYKDNQVVSNVKNRREVFTEVGINDYHNLNFSVNARMNLSNKKDNPTLNFNPYGLISTGSKVQYLNDCILYSFGIKRDFMNNDALKKNTTWWFSIELKNIT